MNSDVLIVGAGLSGLIAAHILLDKDYSVTVLDKATSVGGRMATRRLGAGVADHGAQFFTVRTETFKQYVEQWREQGLIDIWSHGWSDGSLKITAGDGHPRYYAKGGMNNLAKHLAQAIPGVRVDARVVNVSQTSTGWRAETGIDEVFEARALILTPPVPQSLDLINNGGIHLNDEDRDNLERIHYGPCLAGMFVVEGPVNLPEPGAVQNFENPIYWIADNQRKGISDEARVITVHAGASYSRENFDYPDADILAPLQQAFAQYLGEGAHIVEAQLKRWRYSVPLTTHPQDCLVAQGTKPLVFAGDAFGGRGRMEGAFMSGLMAGQAVAEALEAQN